MLSEMFEGIEGPDPAAATIRGPGGAQPNTKPGVERTMIRPLLVAAFVPILTSALLAGQPSPDEQFEQLGARYLDEFPALSPVGATGLGDHRFDSQLDDVSDAARARKRAFYRRYLDALAAIAPDRLSRANRVDYYLLKQDLEASLWQLDTLQQWAWNPLAYTGLAGGSIYSLMARDFAPLEQRLGHVADRLEQLPRLLRQVRATLEPDRVPRVHAETAVKQNRGVLSILKNLVQPHLSELEPAPRARLPHAMAAATAAVQPPQPGA